MRRHPHSVRRETVTALRGVLTTAVTLGALGVGIAPAPANPGVDAPPAATAAQSDLQATVERPTLRLHEKVVVSGHLGATGQPVAGARLKVAIDGNVDTPYTVDTDAAGNFRTDFWVEDWWGFGAHSLWVVYDGDGGRTGSTVRTEIFVVTDKPTPVMLVVNPHPAPVRPGETVQVTGTLRDDKNQPIKQHPVSLVVDPSVDARAFTSTDDQGAWTADLTVPRWNGGWAQRYPQYPVSVEFEGDWWLAPVKQELMLTLAAQPGTSPTPRPSPTPTRREPEPQATTPRTSATATPQASSSTLGVLPPWVTSPGAALVAGGGLTTLVGASMLSHARGRRT